MFLSLIVSNWCGTLSSSRIRSRKLKDLFLVCFTLKCFKNLQVSKACNISIFCSVAAFQICQLKVYKITNQFCSFQWTRIYVARNICCFYYWQKQILTRSLLFVLKMDNSKYFYLFLITMWPIPPHSLQINKFLTIHAYLGKDRA